MGMLFQVGPSPIRVLMDSEHLPPSVLVPQDSCTSRPARHVART